MDTTSQTHRDQQPVRHGRRGRPPLDQAERRQRIILLASDLFARLGYADTTVEAVCKAAGVTKRTIYDLVGDKATLFHAVFDQCHARVTAIELEPCISGTTLRATLFELAHRLIEHALDDGTVAIERAVILERMRFPDLMARLMDATRGMLNDKIAAVFDELIRHGTISPVDTFRTSEIFFDLVVGNYGFRKALGIIEAPPSSEDIKERVEIFLAGHLHRHGLADI